jgi:predicted component of viral defense system (DUF524 family)
VSKSVESVSCGLYELVAQRPGSLEVLQDGSAVVTAEDSYLVKLSPDADPNVLRDALNIPNKGAEGELRFGNFVGQASLGGRQLIVHSKRVSADAVERMLEEVSDQLSALPFTARAPTGTAYARGREPGPEILYHSFALLRDAMRNRGPHDLTGAIEQVLARPHERLEPDEPRLVPIGAASRVDAETLDSILNSPELLQPVAAGSRLAETPVARSMGGRLPERIRERPFLHTTDTPENRFIAGAIETMIDVLRRFQRLASAEARPSAAANVTDAEEAIAFLNRRRHHRALDGVRPSTRLPAHSSVLRARPGYRELSRLYSDLLGRSQVAEPHDVQRLLESRNAADIYEYWCYFQVVQSLEVLLGEPARRDRFAASHLEAKFTWGYVTEWPEVTALYNDSFPRRAAGASNRAGHTSYSLTLRPDITLRSPDGRVSLLDAKLKKRFRQAVEGAAAGGSASVDTFKPEDLHKMHAYRDALAADSAWVLYPGSDTNPARYSVEAGDDRGPAAPRFRGVGAVALRPGADHDGGLRRLLAELL